MAGTYRPTYRKARGGKVRTLLLAGIISVVVAASCASLFIAAQESPAKQKEDAPLASDRTEYRVSFVAVGDNLPEKAIGVFADSQAGATGDGAYDYRFLYTAIKPYIAAADLAYINFETTAGGNDIGPRGYPSFNTTDEMVDAVYDTGFDLIASATNHSYDWGAKALAHSVALWKQKPVLYVGTANNEEDAAVIQTYEKNGITFSLLNYTYGVNGYDESDIPPYAVNYLHEDRIKADVERARAASDVVLVAMHWGTENYTAADSEQTRYAQLLADAGVDVVLGSHPHVIGPLQWVEGSAGNRTLVAYSLGNFISNHEYPSALNELEGMLSCDFVKTSQGVRVENVSWVTLVNHTEPDGFSVYAVKDYTPELASRHTTLKRLDDPIGYLKQKTREIVGPGFIIDD